MKRISIYLSFLQVNKGKFCHALPWVFSAEKEGLESSLLLKTYDHADQPEELQG